MQYFPTSDKVSGVFGQKPRASDQKTTTVVLNLTCLRSLSRDSTKICTVLGPNNGMVSFSGFGAK